MPTPSFVQLFGPVQREGSLYHAGGPTWHWAADALSASTKTFHFQAGFPQAVQAVFKVMWTTPNVNTYIRLLTMDDGPANLSALFQIQGTGRGMPDNQGQDFTALYNQLVDAKQYKHLGFQLWDDGVSPARIYEVRLELVFASEAAPAEVAPASDQSWALARQALKDLLSAVGAP